MFRPPVSSKPPSGGSSRQQAAGGGGGGGGPETCSSPTTTIKEIKSRTSVMSSGSRNLLNNRRQALSMERLNSPSSSATTTMPNGASTTGGSKSSPPSGNSSASGSPNRPGGGLNRTASRVSRFRSAKAVFERLSSSNSSSALASSPRPEKPEKPRAIVASKFVANNTGGGGASPARVGGSSPARSRVVANNLSRFQRDTSSSKSSSNSDIHRATTSSATISSSAASTTATTTTTNNNNNTSSQPKPQPRANSSSNITKSSPIVTTEACVGGDKLTSSAPSSTPATRTTSNKPQAPKPPSKDLIDKIVLEIARNSGEMDPNCTIQDLDNCDISDIPDTIDFEKCFQDVEMMTEEEAKKLLSRKSSSPQPLDETASGGIEGDKTNDRREPRQVLEAEPIQNTQREPMGVSPADNVTTSPAEIDAQFRVAELDGNLVSQVIVEPTPAGPISSTKLAASLGQVGKTKVRFSVDPVMVFDTFAVEDYDRRNDDIDPVAASAEYEMEKSRELQGLRDEDDDEGADGGSEAVNNTILVSQRLGQEIRSYSADRLAQETSVAIGESKQQEENSSSPNYDAAHVESLQREVGLKRILEQNLRDLQSQYYEAVRSLDELKSSGESQSAEMKQEISNLKSELESARGQASEFEEKATKLEVELNDIKDSSQLLEKKYHRAKKIIKDMQSREQSFNRREQLYQQKLDEIEFELGALIESIDRTVLNEGLKFYSLVSDASGSCQHQARLDVFGLLRQTLINFSSNKSTQNPQIKHRVVTILEQQLASLMGSTNGNTSVIGQVNIVGQNNNNTSLSESDIISQQQKALQRPQLPLDQMNTRNNNHRHSLPMNGPFMMPSQQVSSPAQQQQQQSLSQPIQPPQPIGVGGQPTKLFHGLIENPMTTTGNCEIDPSPPQSVNSYPSSNSLNSLNNNNNNNNNNNIAMTNNNNNNNNNNKITAKLSDQQQTISDIQKGLQMKSSGLLGVGGEEHKFQPVPNIQVPYQNDEWHEKPVSEWTTTQVSTWLLALGLDQYISKFEDRNVNGQSLINLDSTVLKGLGVLNSNDRNLLKKKIRELRIEMEKERKLLEKKLKENLKERSKAGKSFNAGSRNEINLSRNDIVQSVGQANHNSMTTSTTNSQLSNSNNNSSNQSSNKSSWKRGLLS